jgi:hypothetical protein
MSGIFIKISKIVLLASLSFTTISRVSTEKIIDSGTNRKVQISRGETTQIQTMYYIKKCKGDLVPPKPTMVDKLKLGSVNYRSGMTVPDQCPSIKINANFADYTALDQVGLEKFEIRWVAENGGVFVRKYEIEVK